MLWNRLLFIVVVGWYNKFVLLSHDKVPWYGTQRFDCLMQVFFRRWGRLVVHGIIYHGGLLWLVHFDPAIVSVYHGFLRRSLVFRVSLVLMFSYCRHPCFRYFGSVVPVYVIWVESYVNCLFHFPCVPMAFSVNKLCFVPQRFVSGTVSMFWNRGILTACESYIPIVFFHSFVHGSSCFPDVDFFTCAWYLVDYAILLVWVSGIFWSDQPKF